MTDPRDATIIDQSADFIAHHEGVYYHAYPDPASSLGLALGNTGIGRIGRGGQIPPQHAHLKGDPWTIGYGQTGHGIRFGTVWTEQQARDALMRECSQRWAAIQKLISAPLAIPQAVALISFVYNLGEANFAGSTLRRKVNAGDYTGAAGEFDKWVKAGGRELPGLVTRRAAERALFESALSGTAEQLAGIFGK